MAMTGFDANGLEPSPTFRHMAIDRLAIPANRLQLAAVEDSCWPVDHFDSITVRAVLEYLYDPAFYLQRAFGWLTPGGSFMQKFLRQTIYSIAF